MRDSELFTGTDGSGRATRRRLLNISAGALATGLAGCTGTLSEGSDSTPTDTPTDTPTRTATSSPEHQFKSPPYENVERKEGPSTTTIRGEIVLEPGQYAQQEIRVEQSAQFRITGVNEGEGTIDVFLLTPESAFAKYQEGESAVFSGALSATDIESIEQTLNLSSGSHFLVFDNTGIYGAEPQGTVRFEFEVTVQIATPTPTETATPPGENNTEVVRESDMPKIRKVTDNFGHTFVWDPEEYHSDAYYFVSTDDEVMVSDDTTVALTVEEVWADPEDTLTYTYRLQGSDHPDNIRREVRSNAHTWDMRREDYTTEWSFYIWLRNQDDIYYQNEAAQSDFAFKVTYSNLTLAE